MNITETMTDRQATHAPGCWPGVERNRHPAGRTFNMLFGVCQVADGFIRIVSLGYLHTRLTSAVARKATEKIISRRKKLLAQSSEQQKENSDD